ncbi:MAG: site-specific DNA-methyltransferase [Chitinispirillaceae bacterium]|nr:site-specific DNA-methyltransferase [Chitinispirillaceae bacterium]
MVDRRGTREAEARYRKISVPVPCTLSHKETTSLHNLFLNYPDEELAYDLSGGLLALFLHTLDIQAFRSDVDGIKRTLASSSLCAVLDEAVRKIEAIRSYGIKGNKRIYVDYNSERKVRDRKSKELNRSQYYYTDGNTFSARNSLLPPQFENRIICGDSLEVLRRLPDNCIDLTFTSPPYNFGLDYESTADAHYWENYFAKLFAIFDECIRITKYGGRIAVNVQPLFSDYIPSHHLISNFFVSKKMIWKGEILWEKNNYNCKYTAWGSWKSPSNPYLKYTWEFIELFCKGTLKKEGPRENANITADEFKKWVVAKWSIAPERNMKEFGHPAMFPEELVVRVIKLFSFQRDVVLDPFNGVGTTSLIARRFGRRYLGIDISQEYCEKAERRMAGRLS